MTARRMYHVIVDQDDEANLTYNLVQPNPGLGALVARGYMAHWWFVHSPAPEQAYMVYIYYGLATTIPHGENFEEINRRALAYVLEHG